MDVINKLLKWLKESNRAKHLLYAIPCGLIFTLLFVFGLANGMEFKDKMYGNKWDWIDWSLTMLGGLIGQVIQLLIIWIVWIH